MFKTVLTVLVALSARLITAKLFVVNGDTATVGQIPYQALLHIQLDDVAIICGGSLLNEEWVLTAAHCLFGRNTTVEVHLGAHALDDDQYEPGRTKIEASEFIIHEQYTGRQLIHDIALVKLSVPVSFGKWIQPVTLPSIRNNFEGQTAIISGWGQIDEEQTEPSFLQYARLKIISNEECRFLWEPMVVNTNTVICARGDEMEAGCHGDSGGPLVLDDGKFTLVGVVGFKHWRNCEAGYPTGFARVTTFMPWIIENISNDYDYQ